MKKKQAYEQQQEAKLMEWRAEIDKLQAQTEKASADARIELAKRVDELRSSYAATQDKLDDLRKASEQQWEGMKSGIEKAVSDVGERIKAAASLFH